MGGGGGGCGGGGGGEGIVCLANQCHIRKCELFPN